MGSLATVRRGETSEEEIDDNCSECDVIEKRKRLEGIDRGIGHDDAKRIEI